MSFFSSNRERRLWLWTLATIGAIYATLGVARTLAGALRASGLASGLFIFCCLLILLAVVTQGLKRWPSSGELGVALGVSAVYLLILVRMAVPTERTHLIEYSVVALLIHEALAERASQGGRVPAPALTAVVAASLVGVLDECIQAFLPSRVFDPRDMLFNALAAVMAISASRALAWVRR